MPLPTGDTIGILAENLRKRNSVLPISAKSATRWAEGLGLSRGGETVIYTGMMYQLMPYITAMNKVQEQVGDTWLAGFVKYGRYFNKVLNISAFMARPPKDMRSSCDGILVNIARLLKEAGVEFGYLYEEELYSGALIYDLGMDDVLQAHARKIYNVFEKYNVKNVITVDPHTTNMLRSVYPSLVEEYNINVKSYMEVLAGLDMEPVEKLEGEVAIHDSCVYARYENVLNEQRTLLKKAGITIKEPAETGKFTWCCGGPVESLYPKKAFENAQKRTDQLKQVSDRGVTMCPLCLVNLQKAAKGGIKIEDISSYFVRAYCR